MMNIIGFYHIAKAPLLRCCSIKNIAQLSATPNILKNTRGICSTTHKSSDSKPGARFITADSESFMAKITKKIPFLNIQKHKLSISGYLLYESVADKINYAEFFDEFALQDTYYSWFVITELHVWMLMVRCMVEGEDGRIMRNSIVQAMWSDVALRAKKLGAHNPAGIRMQIKELSEQFQAALLAYDEGMQGDDKVLAGAIWRRLYQQQEADPEHLDCLVKYIRKQIRFLDNISQEDLSSHKKIKWDTLKT